DDIAPFLPDGFMELAYQKQAVISAKRILDIYGGVFLADVVGLGKTFISALLAQQLDRGHILIICPPVLKDYWEDTFRDFRVPATVESLGKLDRIITKGHSKFKYVFIDEAHRFRNEDTQRYEALHQICWGKKVILVSATPLNNKIDDIFSQLKLFQAPRKSIIPGVPNLEIFFQRLNQRLKGYEKDDPNYVREVKAVATEVRTKILRHVMVRRTRSEIQRFYAEDMHAQGLTFPQIADPQRIVYKFDTAVERVFKQTIAMLREFNYARYTPRLYLREDLTEFEKQSQRNIGAFMKGLLVKRLESSFYAFRNTLRRFIESYERFIEMYESGRVLISTDFDVYDLLEVDNEERLQQLIVLGEVDEFLQGDFQPQFRQKLDRDLQLLHDVQQLWNTITTDPKREQFIADLHDHNLLKGQKLIIFSESAETVDYLYKGLQAAFPNEVMAFTSGGGRYAEQGYGSQAARDLIEANYDPRHKNKQNNIRLLVTTDVLAEGINLHRSHIVVNYDLPWNPTRVLQRVGRVNRVGTEHPLVYIFNFFPTAQSDEHLGLENNIVSKIQAFHDMLGEDARYLSDVEEVTQHDLSGRSRALYRRLNQRETFIGEDAEEERSDLEYLQIIRRVRDEQPKLFEKLKTMPVKARSGWQTAAHQEGLTAHNDLLVTFFRIGRLKRFFASTIHDTLELDFFEAVDLLACEPDTKRLTIPKIYYELLDKNKETFAEAIEAQTAPEPVVGGGHTHAKLALKNVRAALRDRQRLTDEDEAYLRVVRSAFEDGRIPSSVSKRVMQKVKKAGKRLDSLKVLQIMRDEIEDDLLYVEVQTAADAPQAKREIILSAYLIKQPQ
ncbi:MAG: hypothetical protein KDE51_18325, partial [Anaerolineales bacterium]|nr:hypothetical protein [Anaerolineales bacterium]